MDINKASYLHAESRKEFATRVKAELILNFSKHSLIQDLEEAKRTEAAVEMFAIMRQTLEEWY